MTPAADPRLRDVLAAGALYFALVFGTGFILGPIRVLVVTPQLGERAAVLLESPIMLVAIVLAARWTVRRFRRLTPPAALATGLFALACMLGAEFAVMTFFWRMPLPQYLGMRDPVGLAAYGTLLVVFAAMPWLALRRAGNMAARS